MKEVLDSGFLLTHFGTDDAEVLRRTRAKLAALRREWRGIVPSIVIAEVTNAVCREGGREQAMAQLGPLSTPAWRWPCSTLDWRGTPGCSNASFGISPWRIV